MARVERSETDGRGSAVVTRGASETRSGIPRRSIAPRIAVSTAGSGRTTNGRETGHARQARRRDATNSSRGAKPDACWKARRKSQWGSGEKVCGVSALRVGRGFHQPARRGARSRSRDRDRLLPDPGRGRVRNG